MTRLISKPAGPRRVREGKRARYSKNLERLFRRIPEGLLEHLVFKDKLIRTWMNKLRL